MLKNYILLQMSSFKDIFKDFADFKDSLQFFEHWVNTYLLEHLLMTASVSSWFINVITALFLEQTKHSPTQWKKLKAHNFKYSIALKKSVEKSESQR